MTHSEPMESVQSASRQRPSNHPYSPSNASTASTSSASINSDANSSDGQSSQSSAPSSVKSASMSWDGDSRPVKSETDALTRTCKQSTASSSSHDIGTIQSTTANVPQEFRTHPRRTQSHNRPELKSSSHAEVRPPPSLQRQCDRKDHFVESLVDTTSQMIEVIWPLSMVPCGRDSFGGKNLIGLRLFIQEVLRRSKTSYSTLQVALYYLVLIKPCIPKVDFTKEQLEDSHTARAMQCGRRMFLAALILASKYLQDRTYSARAWSKISGLSTAEINSNEIAFVTAVNWKLHIPEPLFQTWTDIVLKYSLSPSSSSPPPQQQQTLRTGPRTSWRAVIAQLTPALDTLDVSDARPSTARLTPAQSMSPPPTVPKHSVNAPSSLPRSQAPLSAPKPEALEPNFMASKEQYKFPPISPRIPQLPTPQMTPNAPAFSTPVAGELGGLCSAEKSMRRAMKQVQSFNLLRCTVDSWPKSGFTVPLPHQKSHVSSYRRTAVIPPPSMVSSPESTVSDMSSQSSRSSRSSSISSAASCVGGALPQSYRLAVQATRRCATLQKMYGKQDYPQSVQSLPLVDDVWNTPIPFSGTAEMSYLRGQSEETEAAAAVALQDLALASVGRQSQERSVSPTNSRRKRERPTSGTDNELQAEVQQLLRNQQHCNLQNNSIAAHDSNVAKSFLLSAGGHQSLALNEDIRGIACAVAVTQSSQPGSRKRVCCMGVS